MPHQIPEELTFMTLPLPNDLDVYNSALTRRHFFRKTATGLGVAALSSLLGPRAFGVSEHGEKIEQNLWKIAPKAKRAIYISLIGAPSQVDLFDYNPIYKADSKKISKIGSSNK